MSLSVRVRFEVFKRDRFTCSYCGKNPPDVLLEVDHIVPRAAGGSDDPSNLATACADCNRGKSDRVLEEGLGPIPGREATSQLRERLEQAAAYTELVGEQEALLEKQASLVVDVWAQAFGAVQETRDGVAYWVLTRSGSVFPNERSVRMFLRRLPIGEIVAAIDVAASRHEVSTDMACRLFYAVCWRRIRGETGPIGQVQPAPRGDLSSPWRARAEQAEDGLVDAEMRIADLRAVIDALAIRLSELTGELESDIVSWAEREAGL